jgi:hypothetical protein
MIIIRPMISPDDFSDDFSLNKKGVSVNLMICFYFTPTQALPHQWGG